MVGTSAAVKMTGDAKPTRMRNTVTVHKPGKSGFCELFPTPPAAQDIHEREKPRIYGMVVAAAPPCTLPAQATDISAACHRRPRHLAALLKTDVRPPINAGGSLSTDLRGKPMKQVLSVERVATRIHTNSLAVILRRKSVHCLHKCASMFWRHLMDAMSKVKDVPFS